MGTITFTEAELDDLAARVALRMPPAPRLLYRNDFNLCTLAPIKSTWGTGAWQDLVNAPKVDASLGSVRLLSLTDPVQVKADGSDIETVIVSKIQSAYGRNNTAALVQTICRSGNGTAPMGGSPTQASFQFLPLAEVPSCYVAMWLKLDPVVVESLKAAKKTTGGAWRQLICLKTGTQLPNGGGPSNDGDYRMQVQIDMTMTDVPAWRMVWDNNAGATAAPVVDFNRINSTVPVPIGEWFQLELYWQRGANGRMALAINGEQVFDVAHANIGVSGLPLNRLMLPIIYTGGQLPAAQWLDSIELWDRPPAKAAVAA